MKKLLVLILGGFAALTAQTVPYTISPTDNIVDVSLPGMNSDFSFLNGKQLWGAGAPTLPCNADQNLGRVYVRTDAATSSSSLYTCANIGPGTYGWTANAPTASALAATPVQCNGTQIATGIAANGNANCSPRGSVGFGYSFPVTTVGIVRYLTVPFACTISNWSMTVDGVGSTTANLTSGSAFVSLTSLAGLTRGQTVSGTGITPGTTLANSPGPASIVLSQAATSTGNGTLTFTATTTGTTTSGSPTVTVASATGIAPGQTVTGTGVPAGATVSNLVGTTVTLSANATASGTGVALTFTSTASAETTSGDVNVISLQPVAAIAPGIVVSGTGIAGGTTVASIATGAAVMLSAPATATGTGTTLTFQNGATIDIWKTASGTALPTVANTITAAALPSSLSAGTSSVLTGWTTAVATGDILGFQLKTVTGSPNTVGIVLGCQR